MLLKVGNKISCISAKKLLKDLFFTLVTVCFFLPQTALAADTIPSTYVTYTIPGSNSLIGIKLDASGNIYVTDTITFCLYKLGSDGSLVDTWPKDYTLNVPTGVAFYNNYTYIANSNETGAEIVVLDNSGNKQATFTTISPFDLALDINGNIYTTDYTNQKVKKLDNSGSLQDAWNTAAYGSFLGVVGIAVDGDTNIYVVDATRIVKLDSNGTFQWESGGFINLCGIAVDTNGFIYVVDCGDRKVVKLNSSGVQQAVWDNGGSYFNNPNGIALDDSGNIYITDTDNNRIVKITTGDTTAPAAVTNITLTDSDAAQGIDGRDFTINFTDSVDEATDVDSYKIYLYKDGEAPANQAEMDGLANENKVVKKTIAKTGGNDGTAVNLGSSVTTDSKSQALAGGDYWVIVTAVDAAGNYGFAKTSAKATITSDPDVTAPTVNTYSPVDNAASVSGTVNLVLSFSENVTAVAAKNIVIKKSSGDSTVETIPATDAKITGSGTSTITINPDATLAGGEAYYVQIDAGAFIDAGSNPYAGIADATTWNFTIASAAPSTPPAPTVTGLTLAPASLVLTAGGTGGTLTATAAYSDGHSENVTSSATWQSSNPAVATVAGGSVTPLTAGATTITATYSGQTAGASVTVSDTQPPALSITAPAGNYQTTEQTVTVTGATDPDAVITATVNNTPAIVTKNGANFSLTANLTIGANTITVTAVKSNKTSTAAITVIRTGAFSLELTAPSDNTATSQDKITVSGRVTGFASGAAVSVKINNTPVALAADGGFTYEQALAIGANTITVEATDGRTTRVQTRTVTRTAVFNLEVTAPSDNNTTSQDKITVTGRVTGLAEGATVSVKINGTPVSLAADGGFATDITLSPGANAITVQAVYDGQTKTVTRAVTKGEFTLIVTDPAADTTTAQEKITVKGATQNGVNVKINNKSVTVTSGSFSKEIDLALGSNTIIIQATYKGQTQTVTRMVNRTVALEIIEPAEGGTTVLSKITVKGRVTPGAAVQVNNTPATVTADGSFSAEIDLIAGENTITVQAGHTGQTATVTSRVTRQESGDIVKISGDGQVASPGRTLNSPLTVQINDKNNNPISGLTVKFKALDTGGKVSAGYNDAGSQDIEVATGSTGRAAVYFTLGPDEGDYRVEASLPGTGKTAIFTAGTQKTPVKITVVQGDNQKAVAGTRLARPVGVKLTNQDGMPVSDYSVQFATESGSLSPVSAITDTEGVAYTSWTLDNKSGEQQFTASARTKTDNQDKTITATIIATALPEDIQVVPVSPLEQEYDPAAGKIEITAKLTEKDGAPVKDTPAVWRITSGEGVLNTTQTLSDQNGLIKNVLNSRSETVEVQVYPGGMAQNAVTFKARAKGYTLIVKIQGYQTDTPLVALAVSETNKAIQAPVSVDGTVKLTLTAGAWKISLGYTNPDSAPGVILPPAQTVQVTRDQEIEFTLIPAQLNVTGKISDQKKKPVPGAAVVLENPLNRGKGTYAVTDADGRFTLGTISGAYILSISAPGYYDFTPQSLNIEKDKITLEGTVVQSLQLTLRKKTSFIEGNITVKGQPEEKATVYAYDQYGRIGHTETDANGDYRLILDPGSYQVRGWRRYMGELILSPQNQAPYDKNPIEVTEEGISDLNLILMPSRAIVNGSVTVGQVKTSGVSLFFNNSATGECAQVFTGPGGTYSIELTAGSGVYRVEARLEDELADTKEITLAPGETKTLDFSLPAPCRVSGGVAEEGGAAVAGAVVQAREIQKDFAVTAATNENGIYVLNNLRPGSYSFTVSTPGRGEIDGGEKTIEQDITLDFTYPRATGTITGLVTDENSQPLAGVYANAVEKSGKCGGAYTDENGAFTLTLAAGEYILAGSKPGFVQESSGQQPLTLTLASGETKEITVKMKKTQYQITGTVKDDRNNPLPDAAVWADDFQGGHVNAAAGADGSYTLSVTPGKWYLGAAANGFSAKKAIDETGQVLDQALIADVDRDTTKNIKFTEAEKISLAPPKVFNVDPLTGGVVENLEAGVQLNISSSAIETGGGTEGGGEEYSANDARSLATTGTAAEKQTVAVTIRGINAVPETATHIPMSGRGASIKLTDNKGRPVQKFTDMVEIRFTYTAEDIKALKQKLARMGVSESSFNESYLRLSYYNPDTRNWLVMPAVQDTGAGCFVARTDHATEFAVVWPQTSFLQGQKLPDNPPSGGGSSGGGGTSAGAKQLFYKPGQIAEITDNDGAFLLSLLPGTLKEDTSIILSQPAARTTIEMASDNKDMPVLNNIEVIAKDTKGDSILSFAGACALAVKVGGGFNAAGLYRYDPVYKTGVPLNSHYDSITGMISAQPGRPGIYLALLETEQVFSDTMEHWAAQYIEALAKKNIMRGTGKGAFEPGRPMTRAEMAKIIDLAAGVPGNVKDNGFTDIGEKDWYRPYVLSAATAGILKGYEDGAFRPEAPVTRAELAAMLLRAAAWRQATPASTATGTQPGVSTTGNSVSGGNLLPQEPVMPDVPPGHWAAADLAAALRNGIMSGYPDGSIRPDAPVTRAEAAKMVAKGLSLE
ncbi:MAG: Serine/threonine-protein kinase PknD [Pelotomaculum sp. PtaU1.Bin035]|nr:MAG: Serine/threonine-protein kinase PknD [Pelotomaculum sp. PtaU1.Bin035]